MYITKEQALELLRFFNNQYIERNKVELYDGAVIHGLLKQLIEYVTPTRCDARHPNGYAICGLNSNHALEHFDEICKLKWV